MNDEVVLELWGPGRAVRMAKPFKKRTKPKKATATPAATEAPAEPAADDDSSDDEGTAASVAARVKESFAVRERVETALSKLATVKSAKLVVKTGERKARAESGLPERGAEAASQRM